MSFRIVFFFILQIWILLTIMSLQTGNQLQDEISYMKRFTTYQKTDYKWKELQTCKEIKSLIQELPQQVQMQQRKPMQILNQVGGTSLPLNDISTNNPNTGNIAMNNYKLTGLSNGSSTNDSCTYGQLQTQVNKTLYDINTTNINNGNLNVNGYKITSLQYDFETADSQDGVNHSGLIQLQNYVQTQDDDLQDQIDLEIADRQTADTDLQNQINQEITDRQTADNNLQTQINEIVVDSDNLIINSDIDLQSTYKIKNSIAPVDSADLTNKQYVDNALDDKVSLSVLDDYYTKTQTDLLLDDKASNDYVNTQLNTVQTAITDLENSKANIHTNPLASSYTLIGGDMYCAELDYETAIGPQTTYKIYHLAYVDQDGDNQETSQPMSCRQVQDYANNRFYTKSDVYQKTETYSKTEVDDLIDTTESKTIGQISADNTNDQNVQLNGYRIQGVYFSEVDASPQDAINYSQYNVLKSYIDTADESLQDQIDLKYENTTTLNNITIADGNVDLNDNRIMNVSTPVDDNDCCNKAYVDSIASGTSSIPVGTIIAWYSSSIPSGWLLCDGSSFSSVTYPDLFAILGSTTLPDFRGYFLRGCNTGVNSNPDNSRTLKSIQTSQNLSHTHTATTSSDGSHTHNYNVRTGFINNVPQSGLNDNISQGVTNNGRTTSSSGSHTHTITVNSSGASESRPENIAVNYIIRAEITGSSQVSSYNIPAIENWDFSNLYKPINVINPTNQQDLVTLNYLQSNYTDTSDLPTAIQTTGDSRYYLNTTTLNSITAPTSSLSLNSQKITNLANPTVDSDALNRISGDGRYYQSTTPLNSITLATANLNVNSHSIVGVLDPTANQHAATKKYVDDQVSAITTPSNITNGTVNLFYSSNQLRLRRNDLTVQQLFDFDATSNLASTFYSNTNDYVSNSDASYLIRNSKTRNHFVMPTIFADLTTNVNANSASTNANTAQVYIGSNSSKTYALRVTSVGQDVEFQCKDLYLFGETSVQIGGNNLTSIGSDQVDISGFLNIYGDDEDGYSLNSYWKIQATAYDLWVPVSHRRFKKDISTINPDELENISFCRFKWNKQEIQQIDEKTSKRINEDEEQFGVIIEDNDIPDRYYKQSQLLGYKTVDLQRLKDDMLQYCIKKIRDQQTTINTLLTRLDHIEARLQIGGL